MKVLRFELMGKCGLHARNHKHHPEDLVRVFSDPAWTFERIGLEAGPLPQWLFSGRAEAGLPVVHRKPPHQGLPGGATEQIRPH
ncbi:hypothetical protein [Mesorhizobium sp. M1A.F.Ca.ET.072.01.1.1]|uniref:hypothetical protein n=1 Tax=Mesorhizobium sp. M1A.F.Ca.ET.072.01.1.1 TaxID=2496753 RepID=UPI001AECA3AA|nr:hypothetical protein [Mesorhizobium sp. M1A.F.Ca.ET.072.01.1.1]